MSNIWGAIHIGVGFFELSTMQYHIYGKTEPFPAEEMQAWDGGAGYW